MGTNMVKRVVGRSAWIVAWVGLVLAPIHALSRFATEAGKSDLDSPVVRAWAEPAARQLRPLLSWSDAGTVYMNYGRIWLPLLLVATVCAFVVRRERRPRGMERWGWWIALTGYVATTLSVFGDYFTPWMEQSFAFLGIPGILTSVLGSTVLGIALLRRRFRPPATAWLLAAWLPLLYALSDVIALGAGLLPMLWAWGIAGRSMARAAGRADAPVVLPGEAPPADIAGSR